MDSNNRRIKAEDSVIHSYEAGEWKAVRLIDERTGNSYVGIDFPRRQHGPGFESFDDDWIEQPRRIRDLQSPRVRQILACVAPTFCAIGRRVAAWSYWLSSSSTPRPSFWFHDGPTSGTSRNYAVARSWTRRVATNSPQC
jgi:hypothetical protein